MIPGMIFHSQFDATREFLVGMGRSGMAMIISIITGCIHLPLSFIFLYKFEIGILGAGIAGSITYWLDFMLLTLYVNS